MNLNIFIMVIGSFSFFLCELSIHNIYSFVYLIAFS